jgi:plasmid maintenance system killer protein
MTEKPARKALQWLQFATELRDLSHPGLRLEKLHGKRSGQYSVRVNDQYPGVLRLEGRCGARRGVNRLSLKGTP